MVSRLQALCGSGRCTPHDGDLAFPNGSWFLLWQAIFTGTHWRSPAKVTVLKEILESFRVAELAAGLQHPMSNWCLNRTNLEHWRSPCFCRVHSPQRFCLMLMLIIARDCWHNLLWGYSFCMGIVIWRTMCTRFCTFGNYSFWSALGTFLFYIRNKLGATP